MYSTGIPAINEIKVRRWLFVGGAEITGGRSRQHCNHCYCHMYSPWLMTASCTRRRVDEGTVGFAEAVESQTGVPRDAVRLAIVFAICHLPPATRHPPSPTRRLLTDSARHDNTGTQVVALATRLARPLGAGCYRLQYSLQYSVRYLPLSQVIAALAPSQSGHDPRSWSSHRPACSVLASVDATSPSKHLRASDISTVSPPAPSASLSSSLLPLHHSPRFSPSSTRHRHRRSLTAPRRTDLSHHPDL